MATSLAQLHKQIAQLERQAQSIKKKDAVGVIARCKEAIALYGITAEELGFGTKSIARKSKAIPQPKRGRGKSKATARYKTGIKYRDDQGNAWSGHGRRPQWYVAAIESGKTPEQLAA